MNNEKIAEKGTLPTLASPLRESAEFGIIQGKIMRNRRSEGIVWWLSRVIYQ